MKILFVAPTHGVGGIASWAEKYRKSCPKEYELISVGVSQRRSQNVTAVTISRLYNGVLDMLDSVREVKKILANDPEINIMHLAVSGKPGTLRDYYIIKAAKAKGIKCIMHCHFGSVWSQIVDKELWGKKLRKTMEISDQIWVLDNKSLLSLQNFPTLRNKVILVPNFIDVPTVVNMAPKTYMDVAFVGNLFPSKGIYELVHAVKSLPDDTRLHIIGPGQPEVVKQIIKIAGDDIDKKIKLYGRLSNDNVISLIDKIDILALPTYYPGEAFPISILEAMSRGKMVISCDRGAIKNMLTAADGSMGGKIVKAKDCIDIEKAILWCQENSIEADHMCLKAYEKVRDAYRTDVVMGLYSECYKKLILHD